MERKGKTAGRKDAANPAVANKTDINKAYADKADISKTDAEKTDIGKTADIIGGLFRRGVCDCRFDGGEVLDMFISSGVAEEFGRGGAEYISMSGHGLFNIVLERSGKGAVPATLRFYLTEPPEYVCGYALECYRRIYNKTFEDIRGEISFAELLALYPLLIGADTESAARVLRGKFGSGR